LLSYNIKMANRKSLQIKVRIKKFLNEMGLHQKDLAKNLGCSVQFLHLIMNYKRPCPDKMIPKIAEFIDEKPEIVGVAFNKMPKDFETACTSEPGFVYNELTKIVAEVQKITAKRRGHPKRSMLSQE